MNIEKISCDGFVTILEIPPKWTVFTYKIPNFDSKCCYRVLYALMGSLKDFFDVARAISRENKNPRENSNL